MTKKPITKELIMDEGYDEELAEVVERGKEIDKELKKICHEKES